MKARYVLSLAAAVSLLVLAACASSPPMDAEEQAALVSQHGVLSHEQLKARLIGNSIKGLSKRIGKEWIEFNDPDGTLRGKWTDGSNNWTGNWTITGPFYCWNYPDSSNGCYLIKLDGDKVTALDKDGSIATDYNPATILQDNPEGL
jgi:hypothetical protein